MKDENIPLLSMRFSHDKLCPGERMQRLQQEFGSAIECIEIDSSPNNPHNLRPKAHSVITRDLVDAQGYSGPRKSDNNLSYRPNR